MKLDNLESIPLTKNAPSEGSNKLEKVVSGIDKNVESSVGKVIVGSAKNKKSDQKSTNNFFDISLAISKLLAKKQPPKDASKKEQTKLVLQYLQKEEKNMLKYLSKYSSKRKFSARKLEKFAEKLRYIKSLIDQIIQKTITNIELLYRKYILKISDTLPAV